MSEENNDNIVSTEQPEKKKSTALQRNTGWGLEPTNLTQALKMAEYLSNSDMIPKAYRGKPADILIAINHGAEFGLKPLQSLSNVAVINGNPSLWGDAPLALARRHPEFEWILEDNEAFAYARDNVKGWEHLKNVDPNTTSICVAKRKGQPPAVREFSAEDVKTAGLGNVHKSYPKDMRKRRARGRALEAVFSDSMIGLRQAEIEMENLKMVEEGYWEDVTEPDKPPKQIEKDREEIGATQEVSEPEPVVKEKPKEKVKVGDEEYPVNHSLFEE
jgi:hypothetical protein